MKSGSLMIPFFLFKIRQYRAQWSSTWQLDRWDFSDAKLSPSVYLEWNLQMQKQRRYKMKMMMMMIRVVTWRDGRKGMMKMMRDQCKKKRKGVMWILSILSSQDRLYEELRCRIREDSLQGIIICEPNQSSDSNFGHHRGHVWLGYRLESHWRNQRGKRLTQIMSAANHQ